MRLLRVQFIRHLKRPWALLFLVIIIAAYVWIAVSPLKNVMSAASFMNTYGDMEPRVVSIAVLGEARPDLSISEIYDEFMRTQGDFLYRKSLTNSASSVVLLGSLTAALFLCRDLDEDSVRPLLLAGYGRTPIFIWLVVRFYLIMTLITVIGLLFVRFAWSVKLSYFPSDYVANTQLRFYVYSMSMFSISMLVAFLLRNPILSALGAYALTFIVFLLDKLIPKFFPGYVMMVEEHWLETAAQGAYTSYVVASVVIIVVCIAASYLIFRRREA